MKKLPAEDVKEQNSEMFLELYKHYKRFFEPYVGEVDKLILKYV